MQLKFGDRFKQNHNLLKGIRSQRFSFTQNKGVGETYNLHFYENRWKGFVHVSVSDYGGRHFVNLVS